MNTSLKSLVAMQLSAEQVSRLNRKIFLNGKLTEPQAAASSSAVFPVIHSARMQPVAEQIDCSSSDVETAVMSAVKAQKEWAKMSSRQRGALLRRGLQKAEAAKDELAQLLTLETSKALKTESEPDVKAGLDILDFYAGMFSELNGQTLPFRPDVLAFTTREPIGVIAAIIPWNVPLMLMALKIGPALVAGNTVVVKSSEYAPLAALRFAELIGSELPPGVLNLISGHGQPTGQALVDHPKVGKVTFTGSVPTGKSIYQKAAGRLLPVTLELGGKSPMIICKDADLDAVVTGAIHAMRFTRQGQSCSASSRIFVHENLFENFLDRMGQKLTQFKIGDPFDPEIQAGAVACQMQFDKIKNYIQSADKKWLHQYNTLPGGELAKGLFVQPTLVVSPDESHKIVQEEVFGPVACILKWKDLDDVLERANNTSYGLAASVWTNDIKTALKATEGLEAGFVQVNQALVVQAGLSYGGFKNSGLGKEASTECMLEHFTKSKTVMFARS